MTMWDDDSDYLHSNKTAKRDMIQLDGVYEGMPVEEYISILERYIRYLEDLLAPGPNMIKVILPMGVDLDEEEEEVH